MMYTLKIENEKEKKGEIFWNVEKIWIHKDNILICSGLISSMRKIKKEEKIIIEVQ